MMMKFKVRSLMITLVSVCVMTGCSSSTPTSTVVTPTLIKTGSSFTWNDSRLDSSGNVSGSQTYQDTVYATGVTHINRTNSYLIGSDSLNASFFHVESNGDLSVDIGDQEIDLSTDGSNVVHVGWLQIPFGSKLTNVSIVTVDSNIVSLNAPVHTHTTLVTSYAGATTQVVNGQTLDIEDATITGTVVLSNGTSQITQTRQVQLSYAPSIGYFTKRSTFTSYLPAFSPSQNHGDSQTLVSYILK
jgi:hypothetical protein